MRSKLLMALIIYFGGFATAIYYLAPASDRAEGGQVAASSFDWQGKAQDVKSSEFAKVAGASMKKDFVRIELGWLHFSKRGSGMVDMGLTG